MKKEQKVSGSYFNDFILDVMESDEHHKKQDFVAFLIKYRRLRIAKIFKICFDIFTILSILYLSSDYLYWICKILVKEIESLNNFLPVLESISLFSLCFLFLGILYGFYRLFFHKDIDIEEIVKFFDKLSNQKIPYCEKAMLTEEYELYYPFYEEEFPSQKEDLLILLNFKKEELEKKGELLAFITSMYLVLLLCIPVLFSLTLYPEFNTYMLILIFKTLLWLYNIRYGIRFIINHQKYTLEIIHLPNK